MREQFIKVPFADGGDKTPIPNATQPDGSISMQQGWGVDYEKEVGVDAAAKSVNRQAMNQVLNISTALLNRWQTETFPEWIDSASNDGSPFLYPVGSIVRYSANGIAPYLAWVNLIDNNGTSPSVGNDWVLFSDFAAAYRDPTESLRGMPLVASQTEVTARSAVSKLTPPNLAPRLLRIKEITASGTYTKPSDVGSLIVYCTGGGGGGGGIGAAANSGTTAGGGGGGSTAMRFISAPAATYAMTVGAGGSGGVGANNGLAGASTSFGGVCVGTSGAGGQAGKVRTSFSTSGTPGQAITGSTGDMVFIGGAGMLGFAGPSYAMNSPSGQSIFSNVSPYGEDTGTNLANGSTPGGYGGGGGGARGVNNGATANGGTGGAGVIYILEFA